MPALPNETAPSLTLREAARIAQVTPDTVARWCSLLGVGFRGERGHWRVHPAKLKAVIEARQVLGLFEPTGADAAEGTAQL
jgi:hypothetical protein